MKAILIGGVAALLLAYGASVVLSGQEIAASAAYATEGVRLSDGH